MLRSKEGDNPAFFTDQLFPTTPKPRYTKVSCSSLVLPPHIVILNEKCLYVIAVSITDENTNECRGNKIIVVPNYLTVDTEISALTNIIMKSRLDFLTFTDIMIKCSSIYSVHHIALFIEIMQFTKYVDTDLYLSAMSKLKGMVNGLNEYDEPLANRLCREITYGLLNISSWYDTYEQYANFDLSQYVETNFCEVTNKFQFRYIGEPSKKVTFTILPLEVDTRSNVVTFNKLRSWLGTEDTTWACSETTPFYKMPLVSHLHDKFVFLKLYLSIVERHIAIGSDDYYNSLLTIFNTKKTIYYNFNNYFVDISARSNLLTCQCIIKNASDEIVQFQKSPQGTTVILNFA